MSEVNMYRQTNRLSQAERTLCMSVSLLAVASLFAGAGWSQTAALHESSILDGKSGSTHLGTYGHHLVAGNMFRPGGIGRNGATFMDFRGEQTCNVSRGALFNRFIPHFTGNSAHMPPGVAAPAMSFRVSDIFRLVHRRKSK
jgi:hypothetical protein